MSRPLRVCALYPDLMNIYADRGNIAVLARALRVARARLRAQRVAGSARRSTRTRHDLFYIGGGQDRDQVAVARDMVATKRDALHAAAERAAVVLAVCGGYQLLGSSYQLGDEQLPGRRAGGPQDRARARPAPDRQLRDRGRPRRRPAGGRGVREPRRAHVPRARRDPARPGASRGIGNNGADGFEGVRRGNVIGTYLHGPLLPKNVWLADRLIELALGVRLEPARRRDGGRRARRAPGARRASRSGRA